MLKTLVVLFSFHAETQRNCRDAEDCYSLVLIVACLSWIIVPNALQSSEHRRGAEVEEETNAKVHQPEIGE